MLHLSVLSLSLSVCVHKCFFLLRSLKHPNILQCLGQCSETIPFLLVMEFCQLVSTFFCVCVCVCSPGNSTYHNITAVRGEQRRAPSRTACFPYLNGKNQRQQRNSASVNTFGRQREREKRRKQVFEPAL